jgi:sterol desaturase/sphingolipid hydroxylase (fatty acid hydroxylase superfamily)
MASSDYLHNAAAYLFNSDKIEIAAFVRNIAGQKYYVDKFDFTSGLGFIEGIVGTPMTIGDFGLYWAHRLGHELGFFWRFHALHHSPARLCFINTGRFHFVDSFKSTLFGLPLLVILSPQHPRRT